MWQSSFAFKRGEEGKRKHAALGAGLGGGGGGGGSGGGGGGSGGGGGGSSSSGEVSSAAGRSVRSRSYAVGGSGGAGSGGSAGGGGARGLPRGGPVIRLILYGLEHVSEEDPLAPAGPGHYLPASAMTAHPWLDPRYTARARKGLTFPLTSFNYYILARALYASGLVRSEGSILWRNASSVAVTSAARAAGAGIPIGRAPKAIISAATLLPEVEGPTVHMLCFAAEQGPLLRELQQRYRDVTALNGSVAFADGDLYVTGLAHPSRFSVPRLLEKVEGVVVDVFEALDMPPVDLDFEARFRGLHGDPRMAGALPAGTAQSPTPIRAPRARHALCHCAPVAPVRAAAWACVRAARLRARVAGLMAAHALARALFTPARSSHTHFPHTRARTLSHSLYMQPAWCTCTLAARRRALCSWTRQAAACLPPASQTSWQSLPWRGRMQPRVRFWRRSFC